jgi:hypothetical protein
MGLKFYGDLVGGPGMRAFFRGHGKRWQSSPTFKPGGSTGLFRVRWFQETVSVYRRHDLPERAAHVDGALARLNCVPEVNRPAWLHDVQPLMRELILSGPENVGPENHVYDDFAYNLDAMRRQSWCFAQLELQSPKVNVKQLRIWARRIERAIEATTSFRERRPLQSGIGRMLELWVVRLQIVGYLNPSWWREPISRSASTLAGSPALSRFVSFSPVSELRASLQSHVEANYTVDKEIKHFLGRCRVSTTEQPSAAWRAERELSMAAKDRLKATVERLRTDDPESFGGIWQVLGPFAGWPPWVQGEVAEYYLWNRPNNGKGRPPNTGNAEWVGMVSAAFDDLGIEKSGTTTRQLKSGRIERSGKKLSFVVALAKRHGIPMTAAAAEQLLRPSKS